MSPANIAGPALIPLTREKPFVSVSAPLAQRFWERGRGRGPLGADNGKALTHLCQA